MEKFKKTRRFEINLVEMLKIDNPPLLTAEGSK